MNFPYVLTWSHPNVERHHTRSGLSQRDGLSEKPVWCGQTVEQTASQAIIHPDGQTANMPSYCSPSRWKGSAPTPLLVGVFQQNRNNYRAGASGGLRCWLSNRRCRVVTAFCCLSEKLSFTWAKNISLALSLLKILRHENSLVHGREVFHMRLNSF